MPSPHSSGGGEAPGVSADGGAKEEGEADEEAYATFVAETPAYPEPPNDSAPILTATPLPYQPPLRPDPTETWSADAIATIVPQLTAQAIRYLTATPTS